MGINISQGIPAGSEEEPWGHNVDPHKPAGLQSCKVRMLWFHPEAGTPVSHPHRCDPQGRSGSMNTGPSEQTHRDHAKRCGKASIRGAVPSEAMLQLPPQKKMLRGEAASTGATTQRARGSVGQTAPCLQGWRWKPSPTPNQLDWSGWWERKASPEQATNTLPNKSLQQRAEDGDGVSETRTSGNLETQRGLEAANKSDGSRDETPSPRFFFLI